MTVGRNPSRSVRKAAEPGPSSARMSRQRRHNTAPEVALRAELHRRGLRFRIHRRPVPVIRREADIVFSGSRIAVFVDGCFWHGCPDHRTHPRRNAAFWNEKIEGNRFRDAETDRLLSEAGWLSVRVWEHEGVLDAADRVAAIVGDRTARVGGLARI